MQAALLRIASREKYDQSPKDRADLDQRKNATMKSDSSQAIQERQDAFPYHHLPAYDGAKLRLWNWSLRRTEVLRIWPI